MSRLPSRVNGTIQYVLDSAAQLVSFPFLNKNYTPETLNEALGGSIGGNPLSSSVLGSIIGAGEQSTFINGQFTGTLTEIDPYKAYWIKPASGSTVFNTVASINGDLINHYAQENYTLGPHMIAYPFAENKPFGQAVYTGSSFAVALQNQGYLKIIGTGTAMEYKKETGWTGNITEFTSGSGYWIIRYGPDHPAFDCNPNTGFGSDCLTYYGTSINIWRRDNDYIEFPDVNTAGESPQFPWTECLDAGYNEDGHYGRGCTHNDDYFKKSGSLRIHNGVDGFDYFPAHSFGYRESQEQMHIVWGNSIGNGSGSLYDSASNDMSGSADGTNDFIVGWFATSSNADPFPMCCGASAWHTHQYQPGIPNLEGVLFNDFVQFQLNKRDGTPQTNNTGYPGEGTPLEPRIYDPRRNVVVTGSVHEVIYDSNSIPSIGPKTVISSSVGPSTFFYVSGSRVTHGGLPEAGNKLGAKVIVMDS